MKKAALVTKIKNGHYFFKIWYKYYTKYFLEDDIYIVDFGSTDGSLDNLSCNIIPYRWDDWHVGNENNTSSVPIIDSVRKNLLEKYEYVIYCDYDEIIFHPMGLDKYIDTLQVDNISCNGFEIIQVEASNETPINFSKPIMEQRNYWTPQWLYSKPAITRINADWGDGFHTLKDGTKPPIDDDLILFHLLKMDRELLNKINLANVIRTLIDTNQYILAADTEKTLPQQLKYMPVLEIPVTQIFGDYNPHVIICPNRLLLFRKNNHCCRCGEHFTDCGHHSHFIDEQLNIWWYFTEKDATLIPDSIKMIAGF